MRSVAERLAQEASELRDGVAELLGPDVRLRDINDDGSSVVFMGASYAYPELTVEQKRLRSRLLERHRSFFAMARSLLLGQTQAELLTLNQNEKVVLDVIEHEYLTWHSSTGEALNAVKLALHETDKAVANLDDPAEGSVLLVPDTNALIASPAIQGWSFADIPRFEVLLVPTLLGELDELKVSHRSPQVRDKAQAVIRQVKEFGRRGNLTEGVPLVKGTSTLRSFAKEPNVVEALPWLDPTVPDDRILASTVEAMRAHPRSTVLLVSGDINLQNKAAFAGIDFLEPPPG